VFKTDGRKDRVMYLNHHHPLVGRVVIDAFRRRIGRVTGVVAEDEFFSPAFLTVTCGRRRRQDCQYLIPAREAFVRDDDVYISYYRHTVRRSPALGPGQSLERTLAAVQAYYRLPQPERASRQPLEPASLPAAA
jgi:hypothetical protein